MSARPAEVTPAAIIAAFKKMTSDELGQISLIIDQAIEDAEAREESERAAAEDANRRAILDFKIKLAQETNRPKTVDEIAAEAAAKAREEAEAAERTGRHIIEIARRNAESEARWRAEQQMEKEAAND